MNPPSAAHRLWYRQPADGWNQALPLGSGRLGAMVFGGVTTDRLQLNEDSLWYGGPRDRTNPDARASLDEVKGLLVTGAIPEAERLAMAALSGVPEHPSHFTTVGDFVVAWEGPNQVEDYHRELDLDQAVCRTRFRVDSVTVDREAFATAVDHVVAVRVRAVGGTLSGRARLDRGRYPGVLAPHDGLTLRMDGGPEGPGGVSYSVAVRALPDGGRCRALGEFLVLDEVESVTFLIAVATTFRHSDPAVRVVETLDRATDLGWNALLARHQTDYRSLVSTMDLDLGVGEDPLSPLATDERLARVCSGGHDPGLVELYFRYGRYLLISSSRPGSLPANLQGIWNDSFLPPWGSKFTININTQMNYWPAEPTNLGDCHQPLLELLERMVPRGQQVARDMYGCRGFVAHHNTDLWADCAPVDHWIPATIWPLGAAWLSLHLWEHFEYSGDRDYLARAYPILREASLFFVDFLSEAPDGRLVTNPSVSPENTYILPSGVRGSMCFGPSMDSQILWALFSACAKAAQALGRDAEFARQLLGLRSRLPQPEVGRWGQLLEWPLDYDEAEPGHRHISHLFALHPGDQISVTATPEWAAACRVTLERRLAQGGGHTGWSKAWIVNLWARLGNGDLAWDNLEGLLRQSTAPNLFDLHPPGVFQIDGNLGATAGLLELLVQSVGGAVHLLPALPAALPQGWVRGARAKGGFEVDLEWSQGRLARAQVLSLRGEDLRLVHREPLVVHGPSGLVATTSMPGGIGLPTAAGQRYVVTLAHGFLTVS